MYIWNDDFLQQLKQDYLKKVKEEFEKNHPENIPSTLKSVFTQDLIKDPVISNKGRVYDRLQIEKWVEEGERDELRQPLDKSELASFPELLNWIEKYHLAQKNYNKKKESLLAEARESAGEAIQLDSHPLIFICPISKQLINNPVISNLGEVYEATAVALDKTVVPFPDFAHYLNFYHWKYNCEQSKQKTKESASSSLAQFYTLFSYLPNPRKVFQSLSEIAAFKG
jgi:hypothetical protein